VAAWGLAVTVLAAPFDELWHRLFGLDVTIWSPPHLMGLLGAAASAAACLLIAREVYPAEYRLRLAAMILAASLTYAYLQFMVGPATRIAYLYGGVLFYAYPILAALVLPPVLVVTARVSGQRAAPVLVLLTLATIVLVGHRIADVGFALLRPVSIVEAEIVKDPTSPIGVAHAIAAKSGTDPGHLAPGALLIAVALPTVMVAADARRRPVVASVVYAATVFAVSAAILPNSPAFRPLSPSVAETLLALTLTVAAALVAGQAARWRV
jgi:hypothetical protein